MPVLVVIVLQSTSAAMCFKKTGYGIPIGPNRWWAEPHLSRGLYTLTCTQGYHITLPYQHPKSAGVSLFECTSLRRGAAFGDQGLIEMEFSVGYGVVFLLLRYASVVISFLTRFIAPGPCAATSVSVGTRMTARAGSPWWAVRADPSAVEKL